MSEEMAIESIAEEYAKLKGYMTETRVHFKLKKSYSDFDVLAYKPFGKKTVVIECKAWGSSNHYMSFETEKHQEKLKKLFKEIIEKWRKYFINNIAFNKWRIKKLDEIWLIIPGFCKEEVRNKIIKMLKKKNKNIEFKIIPIHELILDIMVEIQKDKDIRGKRYSHPVSEFCRWLLRSYEKKCLDLFEVDLKLKEKNEEATYDTLKDSYERFKKFYCQKCIDIVSKNDTGKHTRINVLKSIINKKKKIPKVGVDTWEKLGILCKNKKRETTKYSISEPFAKQVKEIFRQQIKKRNKK